MSTAELFDALTTRRESAKQNFHQLVHRLVAGEQIDAEDAQSILDAAGETGATLRAAVDRIESRRRLVETAKGLDSLRQRMKQHDAEANTAIAAVRLKIDQAEDELRALKLEPGRLCKLAQDGHEEIEKLIRGAERAAIELRKLNPELAANLAAAEMERDAAACELASLSERLGSLEAQNPAGQLAELQALAPATRQFNAEAEGFMAERIVVREKAIELLRQEIDRIQRERLESAEQLVRELVLQR